MRLKMYHAYSGYMDAGPAYIREEWWDAYVTMMIKKNPDVVFFYTVESTDIW